MITVKVTVLNGERLQTWLAEAPARFDRSLWSATEEGTALMADAIRLLTPRRKGTLVRSIGEQVTRPGPGETEGEVVATDPIAKFVEYGTRQHGAAHHMFQRGAYAAEPAIEGRFHSHISRLVDSFGNV